LTAKIENRNGPIGVQAMHDVRINVTIWEYRDVRNWLFAGLEVGTMETNYLAVTL